MESTPSAKKGTLETFIASQLLGQVNISPPFFFARPQALEFPSHLKPLIFTKRRKMKKQLVVLLMVSLMASVTSVAFAATTLHQLGRSPFHKPPLTDIADLKEMVETSGPAIRKGFEKAGYPELYNVFAEQFPTAEIDEIEIGKNEYLIWMLYRKNGEGSVRVAKDITWAGDIPFKAFRLYLTHKNKRYEITVPLICGNLALRAISEAVPVPVVNNDPACRMTVVPERLFCGDVVTVDASGSSDSDGSVSSVTISMVDSQGKVVEEKNITSAPYTGTLVVPCGGAYTVQTKVTDDQGAVATSSDCTQEVSGRKRIVPVAAVGFMHLLDPANFMTMRGGLEYWLNENVSFLGMLGYNFHLDGNQGDDAFSADALALYHFSRYFVGGGLGWWNMDDSSFDKNQREILDGSNLDLILHAGARIYGEADAFNVSLFGEARTFADSLDDIDVSSRFVAGLLFRF